MGMEGIMHFLFLLECGKKTFSIQVDVSNTVFLFCFFLYCAQTY